MADLEYSVEDGIGTIRLNRPERKNAFTLAMVDRWASLLAAARTDPSLSCSASTRATSTRGSLSVASRNAVAARPEIVGSKRIPSKEETPVPRPGTGANAAPVLIAKNIRGFGV